MHDVKTNDFHHKGREKGRWRFFAHGVALATSWLATSGFFPSCYTVIQPGRKSSVYGGSILLKIHVKCGCFRQQPWSPGGIPKVLGLWISSSRKYGNFRFWPFPCYISSSAIKKRTPNRKNPWMCWWSRTGVRLKITTDRYVPSPKLIDHNVPYYSIATWSLYPIFTQTQKQTSNCFVKFWHPISQTSKTINPMIFPFVTPKSTC